MDLEFKSKKLKKICENPRLAQRTYGKQIGIKLIQRINELLAATCLADIAAIPCARFHSLKGKRKNQYAVDLVDPFRLVFSVITVDEKGKQASTQDLRLRIEEVRDYHGKQR